MRLVQGHMRRRNRDLTLRRNRTSRPIDARRAARPLTGPHIAALAGDDVMNAGRARQGL
jgi:hypothetical protein